MNKMLYYPGFEIDDDNWLKFALLYLKEVNTIIPKEAEPHLSKKYKLISNHTNLLKKHYPNPTEAYRSSNNVIEIIKRYIENPIKENVSLGKINIVEIWRHRGFQNYELFHGKFNDNFRYFCEDLGFATKTRNGIKVPSQLAITYMGVLAHNIGSKNNMSIITDATLQEEIVSLSDDLWEYNATLEELKYIKKFISLQLPINIKNINLDTILNLRNQENFQRKLKGFHDSLTQLKAVSKNDITDLGYKELSAQLEFSLKDLGAEIANFAPSIAISALGVYIGIAGDVGNLELIKEGLGFIPSIGTGWDIYKTIRYNPNRLATQYITTLQNLGVQQKRTLKVPNYF